MAFGNWWKLSLLASIIGLAVTGATTPASSQPTTPASVAASPPSAADFARLPFIESADISPNGERMAGLLGYGGQQRIAIVNLYTDPGISQQAQLPEGTQANWVRWVNDDNIVVGLSALLPMPDGELFYITRMIGFNRITGKITKLLWDANGQNAADVLWIAPDGRPEILATSQDSIYLGDRFWPKVSRVNVETGSRKIVGHGRDGVTDWTADANGNLRTGISYVDSSRKFSLLYRGEDGKGVFRTIDVADSRKQESLREPFLFLPGTDRALAMHDDEAGRSGVYEVDLPTQQDVRTVFTANGDGEVERVHLSADGKTLLGVITSESGKNLHWLDPALATLQAQFDTAVGERRARIISFSRDRSKMLVRIDRPDSPGAIFQYDTARGTLQRIAYVNEAFGTRPLGPVRMIEYTARDGLPIEAVLTLPADRAARGLPIVMLPHGGPWARDGLYYDYLAQFIASRGYAVLQPNFRGSTGYGTPFLRKGEGQMGLAMQDDITDGLRWAVHEGIADPGRACIVGASYGGYAAMWGIAKDPEIYRCAISIAGVANLRREVNDFGNYLMGGKYRDDWKRMTPDFAAVSPINAIARIKAPLLLIHGKKDVTVNFSHSNSMYGRMRDAGKTVEFVPLAQADHYFTREADRLAMLTAIESFLARHNPAGAAPAPAAATGPAVPATAKP